MASIARPKSVKAYALRNCRLDGWEEQIAGCWSYRDLVANPAWFKGWISVDALRWNPYNKKLYCGLNSLDGDLLYAFDPKACRFECLNSQAWTDEYDVKIHCTLLLNPNDQCLYFATALLHDLDQQHAAKGGKLVRFDPIESSCSPRERDHARSAPKRCSERGWMAVGHLRRDSGLGLNAREGTRPALQVPPG
jgi:hypothetical protein